MTLVEFFDEEVIDNAVGALLLKPERLVVLYAAGDCATFTNVLGEMLEERGVKTEILREQVDVDSIDAAMAKIEEVALRFQDCDFDITGGNDIMLVAMGTVSKKYNLPLHSVDVRSKKVIAVNSNKKYETADVCISVNELIRLHGGHCTNESREKEACNWQINPDAERDIEQVWEICRRDPGAWNEAMGKARSGKTGKSVSIWTKLKKAGLVWNSGNGLRYKNDLVKYLLSRQGTALEMYTFMCAKHAGRFNDGQSGALLDWKGSSEIENEIDVLLTRGVTGCFISCKNGMVDSNELYKLNVVAERFGGRYAEKILVISSFEPDRSFMERANELGIRIIKNARHLQKKDFVAKLIERKGAK